MKSTHNEGAALLFVCTRQFAHGLKDLYACIIIDVDGICIIVSEGDQMGVLGKEKSPTLCREQHGPQRCALLQRLRGSAHGRPPRMALGTCSHMGKRDISPAEYEDRRLLACSLLMA